jgi:hypothetical protein
MDKLGYTFYPKDFISDPDVMMMSPSERGIYRDLIDLAYMSDNCIKYNLMQLSKYCNAKVEEIETILQLKGLKVGDYWTIPSCDKRIAKSKINKVNGGKGGRPKKPKENPTNNPTNNPNETQTERQREREKKDKEEKIYKNKITIWLDKNCPTVQKMKEPITYEQAEKLLNDFPTDKEKEILADTFLAMENHSQLLKKYKSANLTVRNWVKNRFDSEPKTQLGKADKWTHPDQVDITDLDFFSKIPKPPPIEDAEAQHQWSCTWKVQQHRQYISDNNL